MDEVHQIIEKEKLLASLQVQEQQQYAQHWKKKYDQVTEQVSVESLVQPLEPLFQVDEINLALKVGNDGTFLDLSNIALDIDSITRITRFIVNSAKSENPVCVVKMANCGLSDLHSEGIFFLSAVPILKAIDLSFNSLGSDFFGKLISCFKVVF